MPYNYSPFNTPTHTNTTAYEDLDDEQKGKVNAVSTNIENYGDAGPGQFSGGGITWEAPKYTSVTPYDEATPDEQKTLDTVETNIGNVDPKTGQPRDDVPGEGGAASLADILNQEPDNTAGDAADAANADSAQEWDGEDGIKAGFAKAMAGVDKNLQDQMGGVAARGSMNARRATEMGALQGASGFGGMQAGKQLQSQMATNEFERDLRNTAFEQKMGLQKGFINAKIGKANRAYDRATTSGNIQAQINAQADIARYNSFMDMAISNPEIFADFDPEDMFAALDSDDSEP